MSPDPLLQALSALDPPAPDAALDARTQRAVESRIGGRRMRHAGLVLGIVLASACSTYLAVLVMRASALL